MTSEQPGGATPPAGQYQVDPTASTIRFVTKAMFGAVRVRGSFDLVAASISVGESQPPSCTAHATVSVASFTTRSRKRDGHVKSADFLNLAAYPTITFDGSDVTSQQGEWVLRGALTVRGMPAPVEVKVTSFQVDAATLTVPAAARVDRYPFGVTHSKGMAGRHLDLDLHLVAHRN